MGKSKQHYPYRAFVSYANEDLPFAKAVALAFKRRGVTTFLDRDIPPGADFSDEIREFILSAHLFVPVITEHSNGRPWVHQEIGFAHARKFRGS